MIKKETEDFINSVKSLRMQGIIRFDSDVYSKIGMEKTNFSLVMNGKRDIPKKYIDALKVHFPAVLEVDQKKSAKKTNEVINLTDSQIIYVPLVSQRAYAGYLSGFSDEEYIEDLPKEPFFMDREYKGNYVAFEVRGDSMDDGSRYSICERDIVLGREIIKDHWKNKLHIHKWNFIIVTKDDGILYKQITKHDTVSGKITIHSLNSIYEDKVINLKDVAQLFNVVQVNRKM